MKLLFLALCLSITSVFATPEEYLASMISKKEIDFRKLKQTFKYKDKYYQLSDFDEVINQNLDKITEGWSVQEAKQFAQNYITAKAYVIKSDTQSDEKKFVMSTLEDLFDSIYVSGGKKELEKKIRECREPVQKFQDIEEIVAKVEKSREIQGCKSLSPGEHKLFVKKEPYTSGNYLLKRNKDGNYQALLNVKFESESANVSSTAMMNRVKTCLAEASRAMKGPDGEMLELKVLDPNELTALPSNQRPLMNTVKIRGPNYQTDAANYNEKVDCATITHEALHLLGLCDEYEETRPQFMKENWTCRVVTKIPTIMNSLNFYKEAVPQAVNCECTSTTCKAVMTSGDQKLQTLFTSQNMNDAIPQEFKKDYCKEGNATFTSLSDMKNQTKGIVLKDDGGNSFTFENRTVAQFTSSKFSIRLQELSCKCPAGDESCVFQKKRILKQIEIPTVKSNCPAYTEQLDTKPTTKTNAVSYKDGVLTLHPKPAAKSLLRPGHFNKILTGNCPGPADDYNKCAAFAYKGGDCNIPKNCNDPYFYLGL